MSTAWQPRRDNPCHSTHHLLHLLHRDILAGDSSSSHESQGVGEHWRVFCPAHFHFTLEGMKIMIVENSKSSRTAACAEGYILPDFEAPDTTTPPEVYHTTNVEHIKRLHVPSLPRNSRPPQAPGTSGGKIPLLPIQMIQKGHPLQSPKQLGTSACNAQPLQRLLMPYLQRRS